jgi:hypothetical protein
MNPQLPSHRTLLFSVAMLALAGCGSHHASHSNAAAPSASNSSSANAATPPSTSQSPAGSPLAKAAAAAKPAAVYKEPDWNTPLTKYVPITDNNRLMFYYYANTDMPANYKVIAANFDRHYMDTSDVFTKHKIIKEIKPRVAQEIAKAKAHPYVYWPMYSFNVGNYSFKRHGFKLFGNMLLNGGYISYDSWRYDRFGLEIRNSNAFSFLPVKKSIAKKIEAWTSAGQNVYVQPYVFINGASLDHHRVKGVCTAIAIYGPNKQLVMMYRPKHA